MFCSWCGKGIPDNSAICPLCGKAIPAIAASQDRAPAMSGRVKSLAEKGELIVHAARASAICGYTEALSRFPIVGSVAPDQWDFFMVVGGIFVATYQLKQGPLSRDLKHTTLDAVTATAVQWDPQAVEALADCIQFVDRTFAELQALPEYSTHPEFSFSDSLGSWLVWNLFGHAPESDQERKLGRVLGGIVTQTFMSWWEDA